jgi:hypothetical protein
MSWLETAKKLRTSGAIEREKNILSQGSFHPPPKIERFSFMLGLNCLEYAGAVPEDEHFVFKSFFLKNFEGIEGVIFRVINKEDIFHPVTEISSQGFGKLPLPVSIIPSAQFKIVAKKIIPAADMLERSIMVYGERHRVK